MSGAGAVHASVRTQRVLLSAARTSGGPWGAVLEMCILTICLPWEAIGMELERIDWERGFVPVPARRGATIPAARTPAERAVILNEPARAAIRRIAGDAAGRGQVVTAGRGPRLQARLFRLDRLLDRLAEAAPETIGLPEWNMHGLRTGAADALHEDGADPEEVAGALGLAIAPGIRRFRIDEDLPTRGAERWARILLGPGS